MAVTVPASLSQKRLAAAVAHPDTSSMTKNKKAQDGGDGKPNKTDIERAKALAESVANLRRKLREPNFKMAMRRLGVTREDLLPRVVADFKTNALMTASECKQRYAHFEKMRRDTLAEVLCKSRNIDAINAKLAKKQEEREAVLQKLLDARLTRERRNIAKAEESRQKYESVVEDENVRIRAQRSRAGRDHGNFQKRSNQISRMKQRAQRDLQIKAQLRREKRDRQVKKREAALRAYQEHTKHKLQERELRLKQFLAERKRRTAEAVKRNSDAEMARKSGGDRSGLRRNGDDIAREQRARLEAHMSRKDELLREKRSKRDARRAQQRIEMNLRAETRRARAERKLRALEFAAEEKAAQVKAEHDRRERLRQVNLAIEQQRRDLRREERIRRDRWKRDLTLERAITPGPGHYTLPDLTTQVAGGSWSTAKVKSSIEEIEYRARNIPAPGHYGNPSSSIKRTGGIIARRTKTEMEHMLERAADTPGPGQYKPREIQSNNPQGFATAKTPGMLDMAVMMKRHVPGPGLYQTSNLPRASVAEAAKMKRNTRSIVRGALSPTRGEGRPGSSRRAVELRATARRPATVHRMEK
jgi:hypothetical protein